MIVRTQTVRFTPDRAPTPRKIRIGFEGDNMVERLCFKLPQIAESQTATMFLDGEYANMVILTDDEDRYYVDMTAELVGGDGEHEAYIVIDGGDSGETWGSGTFTLSVGEIPGFSGEIAERYPDALEQTRKEIAENRAEMEEIRGELGAASEAAQEAKEYSANAETAAENAHSEADRAQQYADDCLESASDAHKSAETAQFYGQDANQSAETANRAAQGAREGAEEARRSADSAETHAQTARDAAERAEAAGDELGTVLSGGEDGKFLGHADGKPQWVDAPSGGSGGASAESLEAAIARHNASGSAHQDIRALIGTGGGVGIKNAYVNDSYQLVIEKTDGSGYVSGSLRGPSGPIGPIGPIGPVGATGAPGAQGEQGPRGEKGDTGAQGPQGAKGDTGEQGSAGADGQRGSKILKVTTSTTSYTTTVGGFKPTYRMPLSNVLAESGSDDVQVGDVIWRSYYHYPVGYVDADYVYLGAYVNIRGTTGAAGEDGADGQPGADGYTPVRGTDYWTEADQEAIVQQVIAALGTPVFGRVDENNNIILTGNLADGKYTLKYEDADGNLTEIGTLNQVQVSYTNLADQTSADWLTDKRINSSGNLVDAEGVDITNYIPIDANVQKIHVRGLDVLSALPSGSNYGRVYAYNANKAYVDYKQPSILPSYFYTADYDNTVCIFDVEAARSTSSMSAVTGAAYLRFGGIPTAEEIIITADENIQ